MMQTCKKLFHDADLRAEFASRIEITPLSITQINPSKNRGPLMGWQRQKNIVLGVLGY